MPVDLSIIESTTELGQTVVEVILESASEPGPAGPGVPAGGTAGQVLTKQSVTDFDSDWEDATGGGGAPDDATYLVTTAHGGLSAEVVVGATPGGELGGTWAAPTVDATHSGSTHAAVQAAAESTAAAALSGHTTDAADAHDASAISFTPTGTIAATDVQAAIAEVASEAGGGGAPADADYLVGTANGGLSAEIVVGTSPGGELGGTWASPTVDATHSGSSHAAVQSAAEATAAAALSAHLTDATDAHDASAISILDAAGDFTATEIEGALAELQADHETDAQNLADHIADATAAHAASAVSVSSTTLSGTGTDVQAVFEEIDNLLDDHSARHEGGGADEISIAGLAGTSAALQTHLDDASDAHDASAVSVLDTGAFYTATDVEGVLAEIAPQLGGVPDPIFDLFGAPDTAFEFDTSSLTGLTALSTTPDFADADTTVPRNYYLDDNAASFAAVGHYASAPSAPFTAIAKVSGHSLRTGNHAGGIFVGVATPGVMACLNLQLPTSAIAQTYTSPTAFSANIAAAVGIASARPLYIAIRATSSTSFDFYFSADGTIWQVVAAAHNPGVTIATVGMQAFAQADRFAMSFDFLRIWNSSKTFPGVQ